MHFLTLLTVITYVFPVLQIFPIKGTAIFLRPSQKVKKIFAAIFRFLEIRTKYVTAIF